MKRKYLLWAAAAVVAYLLYRWWKTRSHVLDAADSSQLSDLFDQLNPTVGGTQTASSDDRAQAIAAGSNTNTGILPPALQNWLPKLGQSPPIIVDHFPSPIEVAQ